ncbi:MAG: oligoendopeptidase F [Erysipelotrichaceae bacterium]|nr:oligoendopeptidase F [Erysipelotrichaceae bacterium]
MANRQKKRNEIDDQYKWDLTTIYKDDEQFLQMLEKIDKEITSLQPKDIFKSGESLYNYLKNSDYLEMNLDKLYTYAHLNNDSDTTVAKYDEYVNKVRNIYQKYAQKTNFFEPQLLKINYKTIEKFYLECPELKEYEIYLKEIYRFKKHTLNEQEEAIIKELSKALNSSSDTYEKLTDTDMTFGNIKDEKNKTVELTESNYAIYTHSKNRRVRRSAFKKLMNKYGEFIHTISSTYSGYVNTLNGISNVYKYSNPLEQSLFADDIDVEVYDTLIKTVHENMNVIYKYYNLRNRVLNLKKSHLYDTYVELIDNDSANYSFSEAKEIVLKALSILGDDYTKILEKAFDEKWIDIYNNKGKRGGAYSSGSFLTNPFILMNFEGKLNDVSTLAHELGHSMHSYFSIKNNSYKNSNYQIFVAEIASTVNEMLLANYLLKESDEKTKILVLNNLLDLFKATIYRQTMFAEFEKKMVLDSKNGIILTSDYLCDNYYKLVKEYFGDNVIIDKEIQNEWARIPHFYYDFYVYKYATGLSIASYIATEIFKGNQEMLKNYREFLKIGGRMNPRESLMTLGIDITKKDVVLNAIKLFDSYIEEFNTYISK